MDDQQILDQIVVASRELYSLPAVAMHLLDLTGRPGVDSAQLKACIEQDPALTAKVLRTVNSSLFGLSNPVADLAQAVTMLGIQPLKLLVLGFSLPEGLLQNQSAHVLSWYWRRTLTKAVAARAVCERLKHAPGDEAFVVGMLADIGLLAFAQAFGEPYAKFGTSQPTGRFVDRGRAARVGFRPSTIHPATGRGLAASHAHHRSDCLDDRRE